MNDYKGGFTWVNPKLKDTFKPTEIKFTKVIDIASMYPEVKK